MPEQSYEGTARDVFSFPWKICKWSCSTKRYWKNGNSYDKKKKNLHQLLQVQIVCLSWKSRLHSGTQTSESLGFKQRLSLISFHIGKMRKCHTVHIWLIGHDANVFERTFRKLDQELFVP